MAQHTIHEKTEHFFSKGIIKFYRPHETIIFAGEEPTGVMFIEKGIVEQYDTTSEGNKLTVNMFKPGAFFPMSWAITKATNTYFFAAFNDVTIKLIEAEDAVEFLHQNSDVMCDLLKRVYIGASAIQNRLVLAASGVASERLAFELLTEAYRFGQMIDDSHAIIKVKQVSLAERSGLARETIGRELHKLADDGLVERTKLGLIVSLDKLRARLDDA